MPSNTTSSVPRRITVGALRGVFFYTYVLRVKKIIINTLVILPILERE